MELRVIEKPVVHPDRRFISLVHARRYTGASLLLSRPSTYSHRTVARRLLSRSHLPHVGIRRTRKSRGGEEGRDEQMPAEVEPARGEERRREEGRREEEGREKKIVRNNARGGAFSRDYRRAARRGPPLTGFVNHGRFKVITRRKKRELMAVVEPRCRQEARRKRVEGEETGPVGRPSPIDRLIYSGSIFHRKDENAQPHWLPTLAG